MEWLANVVGARQALDRPVVDGTGLTGPYDITYEPPPTGVLLGPALQAQLGLTLEARDQILEFLVVDHIERPRAATLVRFGK